MNSSSVSLFRIVKMSSPNLNVLTLLGSILTYTSGFLFGLVEGASPAVLQVKAPLSPMMLGWIIVRPD